MKYEIYRQKKKKRRNKIILMYCIVFFSRFNYNYKTSNQEKQSWKKVDIERVRERKTMMIKINK